MKTQTKLYRSTLYADLKRLHLEIGECERKVPAMTFTAVIFRVHKLILVLVFNSSSGVNI